MQDLPPGTDLIPGVYEGKFLILRVLITPLGLMYFYDMFLSPLSMQLKVGSKCGSLV